MMQDTVFRIALAVIFAAGIFYMLSSNLGGLEASLNESISGVDWARRTSISKAASRLSG